MKELRKYPPLLHDLTSLQREANEKLFFTAMKTLNIAQKLYEKKIITYPRTDSTYIDEEIASQLFDKVRGNRINIG